MLASDFLYDFVSPLGDDYDGFRPTHRSRLRGLCKSAASGQRGEVKACSVDILLRGL